MSSIITISRQFGSGGREVSKRLADKLGFAYYDKQLISEIEKESTFSPEFIKKYSEAPITHTFPLSFGRTLPMYYQQPASVQVQIEQTNVIRKLAQKGNAIFVGRSADYTLRDEDIFKVFIYSSDMDKRVQRCFEKGADTEDQTEKSMEKEIRKVDKRRAKYYEDFTGQKWGQMTNYNLCIDTSKVSIKKAVDLIIFALNN